MQTQFLDYDPETLAKSAFFHRIGKIISRRRPRSPNDHLLEELEPAFPGQVFFVGAGICGKVYCDVIARRGGIALDIGAVCDAWLGIPTRPRVARHRWGQDAVPGHLLLEHQLRQAKQTLQRGADDGH